MRSKAGLGAMLAGLRELQCHNAGTRKAPTAAIAALVFWLFAPAGAGAQIPPMEPCAQDVGWRPTDMKIILENHKAWLVAEWNFHAAGMTVSPSAVPVFADLCGADLRQEDLRGAILARADLRQSNVAGVDLEGSILHGADFTGANLQGARLVGASLSQADLTGANLNGVNFLGAYVYGARFSGFGKPDVVNIAGIQGLRAVTFFGTNFSAFLQLRKAFRDVGLREREREATFALERHRTVQMLDGIADRPYEGYLEGHFRTVMFDWTTAYGLKPGRALIGILFVIGLGACIYAIPLALRPKKNRKFGVVRIEPAGRVTLRGRLISVQNDDRARWVTARGLTIIGYALYFSLLSAFHIGWRDLNVGAWLTKLQPREFALRGRGWVRVVSGVQSLMTVYLIAIWALTYFGRPFQ